MRGSEDHSNVAHDDVLRLQINKEVQVFRDSPTVGWYQPFIVYICRRYSENISVADMKVPVSWGYIPGET